MLALIPLAFTYAAVLLSSLVFFYYGFYYGVYRFLKQIYINTVK